MARIQKLESDSSFNLSNVLEGKILTYKTLENGRVVHKAKLHDGSVVEITPKIKGVTAQVPLEISSNSQGIQISLNIDSNALTLDQGSLTTTLTLYKLPTPTQGFAATYQLQGADGNPIGDKINIIQDIFIQSASFIPHATAQDVLSDSSVILNDPYLKFVFYVQQDSSTQVYQTVYIPVKELVDTYTAGRGLALSGSQFYIQSDSSSDTANYLVIGQHTIGLKGITGAISRAITTSLNNYYTKIEVDALVEGFGSNSLAQDMLTRITALQEHKYTGQGAIKVIQNSNSTNISLTVDSIVFQNTSSGLASKLTIKELTIPQAGAAATYQLQGADGNPIGDKINIYRTALPTIGFPGQFLQKTSDSYQWANVDLSNYYTIAEIDALLESSDAGSNASHIVITSVTNNKISLEAEQIPIGLQTDSGTYYPVQKGSVQVDSDSVTIDIMPYLAYDNANTFQAPWIVWFASSKGGNVDLQQVYTKTQVNTLLRTKYNSSDAALLQQLTYSNAYSILDLQSTKLDISDAQTLIADIRQVPAGGQTGQFLQKGSNSYQWADINLQNYYTKSQTNSALNNYYTKSQVDSNYYTKQAADQITNQIEQLCLSNSTITTLRTRLTQAQAAINKKEDTSDASNAYNTLQTAINTKLTTPSGGLQGQFLMKTSNGVAWSDITGRWTTITRSDYVYISATNGAKQRLVLGSEGSTTHITGPTLNSSYFQLTLLLLGSQNRGNFQFQNVTYSAGQDALIYWFWDGTATRNLPIAFL